MSDFFKQEDIDRVLPAAHTPGDSSPSSYVCRKCFRALASYVKATNTLQENVLKVGVLKVGNKLMQDLTHKK